ncbi:MAG TPA: aminopeptidase P N-terminal domain-containing protein [Candidatus Binataceae bacterium]|nr:aminopeptidase P N-terminal domain-containing protein [Candidatus Binataceae bacterium]
MSTSERAEMFRDRRKRFCDALAGSVAVLASAPVSVRSNDVDYVYRQDSDFYYLTGFAEPESVAVFAPGHKDGEYVLFVRPRDKERETWTGRRAGIEGALTDYGADKAYAVEELDRVLPRYLEAYERVYYHLGANEKMNSRMIDLMRRYQAIGPRVDVAPSALLDPRDIIHEMRLFKQPAELDLMRRAAAISSQAHARAMSEARGGMMEWAIEAAVDYTFRSQGAAGPAYPSIVASGPNATILHYVTNDRALQQGELMMIDAGCEYDYYASDISRTFPIAARFNSVQRELYQIVLESQLKAIDSVKPGVRVDQVHETALRVLVDGMRAMKLLQGSTDEIVAARTYHRFYMHRTSHWLGMDVHDVGRYRKGGESRPLEPGMVLTVEPGLYISADDESAPKEMRGIGIRIEDDVLVTAEGHEVLTAAAPKQITDIEALTAA